jgi:putative nucleotidyltransferase with HDIG domain
MNANIFNSGDALSRRVAATLYRCLEDLGSTKGAYYAADPQDGAHYLASHYGWPRGTQPPEMLPIDHPLLILAHHERRSFAVNEAENIKEMEDFCQGAKSPRFFVTPVYDKGDRIGLLVQRDRLKGEPYDLAKDEARTAAICQDLVEAHRELLGLRSSAPVPISLEPPSLPPPAAIASSPSSELPSVLLEAQEQGIPASKPVAESSPPIPEQGPPVDSMFRADGLRKDQASERLESIRATVGGSTGFAPITDIQTDGSLKFNETGSSSTPMSKPVVTREGSKENRLRTGMFLPEQRTFFWELSALLCQVVPLAAVSLWMEEDMELRPVLTYSEYPLSSELKQQVLAYVTFHIPKVSQEDLQILSRVEYLESQSLSGNFLSYLPILLKEETGGQDLLLLLRMDDEPFTAVEQDFIQRVAKILGFHLQESRLHERYHHAFLSVANRILTSVENRAPRLRSHSLNTAKLARNLAIQMEFPSPEVETISIAAILHDIGSLLLDQQLFIKPYLAPDEWSRIRTHPVLASTFLKDFVFPFDVLKTIRHHHEWWDGRGYPEGMQGENIPIGSRIIAIAEAYEVMSSGTPYKAPMTNKEIVDELRRMAGSQFDPTIVSEFLRLLASHPQP